VSQNRKLSLHEIESYRKRHPYDHAIEVEEGKIRREKTASASLRRKGTRRIRRCLNGLGDPGEDLVVEQYEASAIRELRNALAHKRRLAGLADAELDGTVLRGARSSEREPSIVRGEAG